MYSLMDIREYITAGEATHAPTEASKAEEDNRDGLGALFRNEGDLNALQ